MLSGREMGEVNAERYLRAYDARSNEIVVLRKFNPKFSEICDDFEEIAALLEAQPVGSSSNRDLANTLEGLLGEITQYLQFAKPLKE